MSLGLIDLFELIHPGVKRFVAQQAPRQFHDSLTRASRRDDVANATSARLRMLDAVSGDLIPSKCAPGEPGYEFDGVFVQDHALIRPPGPDERDPEKTRTGVSTLLT